MLCDFNIFTFHACRLVAVISGEKMEERELIFPFSSPFIKTFKAQNAKLSSNWKVAGF